MKYEGQDELKDMLMDVLSQMEDDEVTVDTDYEEVDEMMYEGFEEETGMGDDEMKLRGILDKIIQNTTLMSALGVVPAMMFVGGGAALALGIVAILGTTLKDSAFFKRKGYDKFQSGHHYGASDKSRMNRK